MSDFDVVIPVSYKDSRFLNKILPWIRKNLEGAQIIYILTSKRCFRDFDDSVLRITHSVLLDENTLIDGLSFGEVRAVLSAMGRPEMTGWYFQQFLKIGFARTSYAKDYYLVWDSDTVPLQKLSFFDQGHILYNTKKEHHKPYFYTITKLLGISKFMPYSFITEHMMMKTSIMREMMEAVTTSSLWWKDILNNCDLTYLQAFSEFETYGTYCVNHYPALYKQRQLITLRCGGLLFGRQVSSKELSSLELDFDTVSFERGQYPPFPRSVRSKLERFWIEMKYKYL